jgi:superfamily II DNA or RNA helicase
MELETNAVVMPWPAPRTGAIKLAAGAGPNGLGVFLLKRVVNDKLVLVPNIVLLAVR